MIYRFRLLFFPDQYHCLSNLLVSQDRISVVGSGAEHDAWLRWLRREGKRPLVEFVQTFLDDLSKQATTAQKVLTSDAAISYPNSNLPRQSQLLKSVVHFSPIVLPLRRPYGGLVS